MLPDRTELRESLEALVLTPVTADSLPADGIVVTPRHPRQRVDGTVEVAANALVLSQRHTASLNAARLCGRVADSLDKAGHVHCQKANPARTEIAARVVAMALLSRPRREEILAEVNRYTAAVSPARLSIWSVLSAPATNRELDRFGDFCYGIVDIDELGRACQHAGSNYAELWGDELRDRRCIVRTGRTPSLIDFAKIERPSEVSGSVKSHLHRLTHAYYTAIGEQERREFLVDLDRQQAMYAAAGLGTISAESLMRMEAVTNWVAVFSREQPQHGWVVPVHTYSIVTTTEPRAYAAGRKAIADELCLGDWGQRPLDESLQRFGEYFTGAQTLARHDRLEEALLHFVFGLDLLMGGEATEALTAVLSERVALVSHKAVGKDLIHIVEFMRESYDMRSGYAHRGSRGRLADSQGGARLEDRVDQLERIGRAVFGAGCVARREPWAQDSQARGVWMKRIDHLRAKRAAMPLDAADYSSLGLDRVHVIPGGLPALRLTPG
jgi:hypothetical protein